MGCCLTHAIYFFPSRLLSLHGYCIPTVQLVALVRLLWELLLLPEMDPNLQTRLARAITRLIK